MTTMNPLRIHRETPAYWRVVFDYPTFNRVFGRHISAGLRRADQTGFGCGVDDHAATVRLHVQDAVFRATRP